jgi:hypothetical protein
MTQPVPTCGWSADGRLDDSWMMAAGAPATAELGCSFLRFGVVMSGVWSLG